MKRMNYLIYAFCLLCISSLSHAQSSVQGDGWKMHLNDKGTMDSLSFKNSGFTALFNQQGKGGEAGPRWYVIIDEKEVELPTPQYKDGKWSTGYDYIDFHLEYKADKGKPCLWATIRNGRPTRFQPTKAGIRLGVDTYMDHYPVWESKLFPTLLRSEKTHFWGYFMSPLGKILYNFNYKMSH